MNRGVLGFLLRRLPLDARGRRAVDEVLADWRHEARACSSGWSRVFTHSRFALAMFHVLVMATARPVSKALVRGVAPLTVLWVLLFYLAASAVGGHLFDQIYSLPASAWPVLMADGFVSFLAQYAPMALFLAVLLGVSEKGDRRSMAGWGAGVAVLVVAGWVLPVVNQHYRVVASGAFGNVGIPVRGLPEMSIPELMADGSWPASAHVLIRVSLALSCPLLVWMATSLRPVSKRCRRLLAAAAVVTYVVGAYSVFNLLPKPVFPWAFPTIVAVLMATPLARREQVA